MSLLRSRLWFCAVILGAMLGSIPSRAAHAQFDVRVVLMQVILQLQTGSPDPSWYGAELWQTIALQTGNTGVYPWLAQLGPVQNVYLNSQEPLPTGELYLLTAQHQNGTSTWILGISTMTGRIEYATAAMGASAQSLPKSAAATGALAPAATGARAPASAKSQPAAEHGPDACCGYLGCM